MLNREKMKLNGKKSHLIEFFSSRKYAIKEQYLTGIYYTETVATDRRELLRIVELIKAFQWKKHMIFPRILKAKRKLEQFELCFQNCYV